MRAVGPGPGALSACAPHAARRTRHAVREVLLCAPPAETESVRSLMGAQLNLILRGTARPGARSASVRRAPCEGWGGAGLAAGTGCADAGGGRIEAELHALPGVRREARRHRSGPSPVQADGRGRANRRRRRRGGPWRVRHGQEPRAAMASRGVLPCVANLGSGSVRYGDGRPPAPAPALLQVPAARQSPTST